MFYTTDDEKLMQESRNTLRKINESRNANKNLMETLYETQVKMDRGRSFYETYEIIDFEGKMKIDLTYYDQFLQKLNESHIPQVEQLVTLLYKDINAIYEFINIKPEIFGKNIDYKLLENSMEDQHRKLSKVIYEYLDRNFYGLTAVQRKEKYFEAHKELAKQLITEGTTPEEAIVFSIKTVVMENLLRHVAFPFSSWSRLNYLIEDENYGEFFDRDKLITLVNGFEKKLTSVAKIISTCV